VGDEYVGADVHQATTTFTVRDAQGKVTCRSVVRTEEEALLSFVRSLPGRVHLTFEESCYAEWLYELLVDEVAQLVVCNARRHVRQREEKGDQIDADELSERLRGGFLKGVYHRSHGTKDLRRLVVTYRALVRDSVRVGHRTQALLRGRGLSGVQELATVERKAGATMAQCLSWFGEEHECLQQLRAETKRVLERESRRHPACRLLESVPGIGWVRAAFVVSQVRTPHRFRTKRQLWKYSGLAVVVHSSSDHRIVDGEIVRQQWRATRGLNREANKLLKETFKAAAVSACQKGHSMHGYWRVRVAAGMRPEMAHLTAARKIAATCLALWKKGERFELSRVDQPTS
jgi:transposase